MRNAPFAVFVLLLAAIAGCESTDTVNDHSARQDDILKNPYGFTGPKPENMVPGSVEDRTNISGGGISDYDDKAMKRDLKSVFDP
jgi:hypothetical protein